MHLNTQVGSYKQLLNSSTDKLDSHQLHCIDSLIDANTISNLLVEELKHLQILPWAIQIEMYQVNQPSLALHTPKDQSTVV